VHEIKVTLIKDSEESSHVMGPVMRYSRIDVYNCIIILKNVDI